MRRKFKHEGWSAGDQEGILYPLRVRVWTELESKHTHKPPPPLFPLPDHGVHAAFRQQSKARTRQWRVGYAEIAQHHEDGKIETEVNVLVSMLLSSVRPSFP